MSTTFSASYVDQSCFDQPSMETRLAFNGGGSAVDWPYSIEAGHASNQQAGYYDEVLQVAQGSCIVLLLSCAFTVQVLISLGSYTPGRHDMVVEMLIFLKEYASGTKNVASCVFGSYEQSYTNAVVTANIHDCVNREVLEHSFCYYRNTKYSIQLQLVASKGRAIRDLCQVDNLFVSQ